MTSQNGAALDSGLVARDPPRSSEGLADRVREAYERKVRASLSGIAAKTGILKNQVNEVQAQQLDSITQAVEHTDQMLGDFFEFFQNELGGGIRIVKRPLDLRLVCERVVDTIQRRYPYHTVEFARCPRIDGQWDPDRIGLLLSKLVLNGIEHGASARGVCVRLEAHSEHAVVEVWNGGPPLDEVLMRRMFEPFVRGPSTVAEGGGQGLGLGLYLVRAIARAHGGRIEVVSNARDGTAFRVILPRA
jgi:signal transduction histidine kinase